MKTKLQKLLTLSLLVFCCSVSAANISQKIALWDQVDRLLCVGRTGFSCTGSGCYETSSTAVWSVDFSNMVIDAASLNKKIKLLERQFLDYSSINNSISTVFLGDIRTMNFSHKNNDQTTEVIRATVTETHYLFDDVTVTTTEFECYKQ